MQYRLWQVVTAIARRLPSRVSYAVAVVAGWLAFYCWPRGRRATISNFRRVLKSAPPAEVRRVARASLVNYCRYLADFIRFAAFSPAELIDAAKGRENYMALDAALQRGKGVIFVCMHLGNWDTGAASAAARGYPITVIAETFADRRLDEMIVRSRKRLGMQVVKMEKAGPSLLRALKQNGLLALLIDRPIPGDGIKVNFFDEEVEVPSGPARLALRSGATVVPAAFPRIDPNRFEVTALADFAIDFHPTGEEDRDIQGLTQAIMSAHERYIRAYPDQWYMFRYMWPRRTARASSVAK
jgi:lauroyl/myristoyl acyltransferase